MQRLLKKLFDFLGVVWCVFFRSKRSGNFRLKEKEERFLWVDLMKAIIRQQFSIHIHI